MTEASPTAPRATRRKTSTVTVHEVAALAGVSPSTVSRAMRAPEQVSEAALEAVMHAVEQTNYVPNRAASDLASNHTGTVAALMPALTYTVFADIVHGLESVLSDAGIQLFIGTTGYDEKREEKVLRAFLSRRPNGIVIVGSVNTDAGRSLLRRARIPVVEAWDWTNDPVDSLVGFSNAAVFEAIAEYVVDRRYRRPAFAGWLSGLDSRARARRDGFVSAMGRLRPGTTVPVLDCAERGISIDAGRWLLTTTLQMHPDTDVLVCASDIFATGALLEAQSRGLSVPDDLGITGFGDFELSRHLSPALTTVQTPNETIGQRAAELLLERIAMPELRPVSLDVGFTLLERGSA